MLDGRVEAFEISVVVHFYIGFITGSCANFYTTFSVNFVPLYELVSWVGNVVHNPSTSRVTTP
jgi:hypothetical protein